jgi:hypothetical protein
MGECTASLKEHINTVLLPRGCIASYPEMADEGRFWQKVNYVLSLAKMVFLVSTQQHLHPHLRTWHASSRNSPLTYLTVSTSLPSSGVKMI